MKTFKELLKELNACDEAIMWAENKTIEEVVETCHRGDWLLWLAKKVNIDLKLLTLAKVICAKTVLHLMKDKRSIKALEVAERFALTDEVTLEDLKTASKNAYAAAYAAAAAAAYAAYAAAAYVSYVAAYVDVAYVAAYAAAYAADVDVAYAADVDVAYAADVDVAYAADAAAAYAGNKNRQKTADICREILGKAIIERVNSICQS